MDNFSVLEKKRELYRNVYWVSRNQSATKIYDLEDSHIVNCLRKCIEKEIIAERAPFCEEMQSYENRSYKEWIIIFTVEYQYRKAVIEESNNSILESLRSDYEEMFGDVVHEVAPKPKYPVKNSKNWSNIKMRRRSYNGGYYISDKGESCPIE